MEESKVFDSVWAVVELMGHAAIAGCLSEVSVAGQGMLRIYVPPLYEQGRVVQAEYVKYFSTGAVYSVTPVTEEIARMMATRLQSSPVPLWTIPRGAEVVQASLELDDDDDWLEEEEEVFDDGANSESQIPTIPF